MARNRRLQGLTIIRGEEVARRFGQVQRVHRVEWNPDTRTVLIYERSDTTVPTRIEGVPRERLVDVLGRQGAEHAIARIEEPLSLTSRYWDIEILTAEGRGNVEFYNRIVALRLRSMVRRLDPGARIETGRIGDNAVTLVHMTPDMRRRLVTDGLPDHGQPADRGHRWRLRFDRVPRTGHAGAFHPLSPGPGAGAPGSRASPRTVGIWRWPIHIQPTTPSTSPPWACGVRDGRSDLRRAIANVVAEAGRGAAIGFGLAGPIRPARGIGMLVGAGLFGGSQAVIEAGRLVTGRRVPSDPMPVANMTRLDNVARRALIEGSTTGVVSLAYDVLARAVGDRRVTPGSATHHAAYAVAGGIAGEGIATAIVAVDRAAFDSGGYLNLMGETASAVLNRFSSAIGLMRDTVTRTAAAAPPRPARAPPRGRRA